MAKRVLLERLMKNLANLANALFALHFERKEKYQNNERNNAPSGREALKGRIIRNMTEGRRENREDILAAASQRIPVALEGRGGIHARITHS